MTTAHEHKTEQLDALLRAPVSDVRSALEQLTTVILDDFCAPRQQQLFRVLMSDGMRLAREGRINLIERMTNSAASFQDLLNQLVAGRGVRPRHPELLSVEFMGPLLLWRHWHAILPDGPLVANRDAFVRDHVDHFLQGATAGSRHRTARTLRRKVTRRRSRARVV